jgi:hypothetical protein
MGRNALCRGPRGMYLELRHSTGLCSCSFFWLFGLCLLLLCCCGFLGVCCGVTPSCWTSCAIRGARGRGVGHRSPPGSRSRGALAPGGPAGGCVVRGGGGGGGRGAGSPRRSNTNTESNSQLPASNLAVGRWPLGSVAGGWPRPAPGLAAPAPPPCQRLPAGGCRPAAEAVRVLSAHSS